MNLPAASIASAASGRKDQNSWKAWAVDPEGLPDTTDSSGRELVARYLAAFADDDVDALVSLSRAA